jgi:3-methyladenine DNA glycosylase/8-oxoguanine DNA glycosylase
MKTFYIDVPSDFSLRTAATGHGWYDLAPFEWTDDPGELKYSFLTADLCPVALSVVQLDSRLVIRYRGNKVSSSAMRPVVERILRIDEDLADFYDQVSRAEGLDWVSKIGAGRLLRSASVYEDLVKTICTTNCTWSLTKMMVSNLVEKLGPDGIGFRAFPDATMMAAVGPEFYVREIRAGYRSSYLHELANAVENGEIDPESWLTSDLDTPSLKKEMKKVKGVGDYAAEHMLKLLGRYDGLALDSWIRSQFYNKHRGGERCGDDEIIAHYQDHGRWRGLAIWCDVTERWFADELNR